MEQKIYHSHQTGYPLPSSSPLWMVLSEPVTFTSVFWCLCGISVIRLLIIAVIKEWQGCMSSSKLSEWEETVAVVLQQPPCCCVVLCSPDERRFCVFSLAVSTDGNEILGGWVQLILYRRLDHNVVDLKSNTLLHCHGKTFDAGHYRALLFSVYRANDGCLYVFDLEQNKRTLKVSVSDSTDWWWVPFGSCWVSFWWRWNRHWLMWRAQCCVPEIFCSP